jgi:hypothetical protein
MAINNLTGFGRSIERRSAQLADAAAQSRLEGVATQLSALVPGAVVDRDRINNQVTVRGRDVARRYFDDERFHLIGRD